ncbi:UDP-N-acetylmuramoyl-L-alanine--D-glutamate ligase [Desulfobulbus rhabdoformis]|uniref:UDP-N-acetylmuramoyl-L-alanine--D-glutamate ligase n=1 Tax=Desulfobulbus rhabdoformis TaxID=34032 RepID=UPI001964426B|nr:UDP-N-acetylmuramoyl-L-alanine--D-glutamate ligase [Desulfobulbus rhabdoformis]MBM9613304.1 UDP-N-acetylmuramoyl-L-alanine--D-glutamate ligase [Desulfobulbus rhabdoformis]
MLQLSSKTTAVVIGLGTAGMATLRDLLRQGVRVKVSDQRAIEAIDPQTLAFLRDNQVVLETGAHSAEFIQGADLVVPGPGVPLDLPVLETARGQNIPLYGELALAAGRFSVPVIAVTGSNGKTTVTSLIGELLQASGRRPFVGGNIGTPLLDFFDKPEAYDCAVLELSSFQLDLAGEFRPNIGLLLNITPDHIDRHGSLTAYTRAKQKLFAHQTPGDLAILGGDDTTALATPVASGVPALSFGRGEQCAARVEAGSIVIGATFGGDEPVVYPLEDTKLASSVNQLNAAAAVLAATLAGCDQAGIARGLIRYQPPPHRMAEVAVVDGVRFINDSKATNIGALEAALDGCEAPVILIAGGRDKKSDFTLLQDVVRRRVKALILLGEAAPLMKEALGSVTKADLAATMKAAVIQAFKAASPGDLVLLAPGCASFDMFSGYAERGEVFAQAVRGLNNKKEQP